MLDVARESSDWFAQVLTVDNTGAISREAVEIQRREYHGIYGDEAGDALIEQEYFCSFEAAVLGSCWGKQIREAEQGGRIPDVAVNRYLRVNTAWDIGVDDAMAIWCFQVYFMFLARCSMRSRRSRASTLKPTRSGARSGRSRGVRSRCYGACS
ncbi:hypothetical protein SAMN05216337_104533 [Bradyrhizobium brasilense]|uniref:Uncharacterized protein n=1 Tax=Bradyrhizobium brasilense TaxID=1419277 RepID=A0A1G7IHC5_9BRAD|nr:hypothetical protein SAMN05216337_104533 [Bradyrhizobium brasilense]